jgi:hypothetical protein
VEFLGVPLNSRILHVLIQGKPRDKLALSLWSGTNDEEGNKRDDCSHKPAFYQNTDTSATGAKPTTVTTIPVTVFLSRMWHSKICSGLCPPSSAVFIS